MRDFQLKIHKYSFNGNNYLKISRAAADNQPAEQSRQSLIRESEQNRADVAEQNTPAGITGVVWRG
ncbi:hypothetical protein PN925_000552 [Morganella morganii]|uniref:Uncharacterized protein n=1 Tax=Morganella morganii TaxID=582 RepID=A0AAI9HNV9_MORMO|nr:hypothetical protein [Morganella morganii]